MPRMKGKARKPAKTQDELDELAFEAKVAAKIAETECNDYTPKPPESTTVVKKSKDELQKLEDFYLLLGTTPAEVEAYPKITSSFEAVGGVEGVLAYFRASDDRGAKEIVRLYGITPVKLDVPFEAYCVSAKLSKKKVLQILIGEASEQSDNLSTLLAAIAHPKIVEKTIKVGLSDEYGASEARNVLHKNRGFTPLPKSQQVNIHGNVHQDNRQDNSQNATINIGDLDLDNEKINRATDRFNESRVFKVENESEDETGNMGIEGDEDAEFVIETGQ